MESYAQLVGWQYVLLPIDMRLSAYSWVVKFHVLNVSKLTTTIVFPFLKNTMSLYVSSWPSQK